MTNLDMAQTRPLADFVRNHEQHVARLKQTRSPEVLTVSGQPEVVVQDADSYQALLDRLHELEEKDEDPPVSDAACHHSGTAQSADPYAGLRRATPEEIAQMLREQGVRPVERFEDLLGDFWPEDETCDEFISWLRQGRHEESP